MEQKKDNSGLLGVGILAGVFGILAGIFGKQLYDDYVEDKEKSKAKQEVYESIYHLLFKKRKRMLEKKAMGLNGICAQSALRL